MRDRDIYELKVDKDAIKSIKNMQLLFNDSKRYIFVIKDIQTQV